MPGHIAFDATAVYDVITLFPPGVERFDQLRRILQIAIEQHDAVLGRKLHAAAKCHLRTEISRVRNADHSRILRADFADHLRAVVGTAIVDENDLVINAELVESVGQTSVHDRDRLTVLVTGDDGGDTALAFADIPF